MTRDDVVDWLTQSARPPGRPTGRRLRLFSCACVRRIWDLFEDPHSRARVEVGEQMADGLISESDWMPDGGPQSDVQRFEAEADDAARHVAGRMPNAQGEQSRAAALRARSAVAITAWRAAEIQEFDDVATVYDAAQIAERDAQVDLYFCVCGPIPIVEPAWSTPTVVALAQAAYDGHDWTLLPLLADALEDAGCTESHLLKHLRIDLRHGRGCWAVDPFVRLQGPR